MKIIAAIAAVLVAAIAGGLAWLGMFTTIEVQERDMGPYPFVYVQDAGTDPGGVADLTHALGERLERAGFARRKPAQVYFPPGRGIQNQVGFVVERAVGPDVLGSDTFFRPIPVQRCLVARFPFRNRLSFRVGAARAEPALAAYRQAQRYGEGSVMVILEGDTILYVQPITPG